MRAELASEFNTRSLPAHQPHDLGVEVEFLHPLLMLGGVDIAHRGIDAEEAQILHIGCSYPLAGRIIDQEFHGELLALGIDQLRALALPTRFGKQL